MDHDKIASTLHCFQLKVLNSDADGGMNGGVNGSDTNNTLLINKIDPTPILTFFKRNKEDVDSAANKIVLTNQILYAVLKLFHLYHHSKRTNINTNSSHSQQENPTYTK